MWSGAWNKRKLTSEISNRFLAISVGRAEDWWSGGCGFKPHWVQFLTKFILFCVTSDLSDNLTEMRQTGLSWKIRINSSFTTFHEPDEIGSICTRGFPKEYKVNSISQKVTFNRIRSDDLRVANLIFYLLSCSDLAWKSCIANYSWTTWSKWVSWCINYVV